MGVRDYLRQDLFPTIMCAGCGHGIVLNAMISAIDSMSIEKK